MYSLPMFQMSGLQVWNLSRGAGLTFHKLIICYDFKAILLLFQKKACDFIRITYKSTENGSEQSGYIDGLGIYPTNKITMHRTPWQPYHYARLARQKSVSCPYPQI